MINLEIFLDGFPWLLRDYEKANSKLGHNRHRVGRNCGRISASLERLKGEWANFAPRLPGEPPSFHVALFEGVRNQFGVFDKEAAPFVLINAKAVIFDRCETASNSENEAAV